MPDILKDRERAFEAEYFRKQDEKLLAKMRERAALQEVAEALADKLRVQDTQLLQGVLELGLTSETGTAILLAPLVQVAWAEGKVTPAEREVVLETARSRGVMPGTPAYAQIETWLRERPSDSLFDTAMEVLKVAESVLPAGEREERIREVVAACRRVAEASGGNLSKLLGLTSTAVSQEEAAVLDAITAKLRSVPPART
jgi:hypothetical protein